MSPPALGSIYSPLACACMKNDVPAARALLEDGADPNKTDDLGTTPLMMSSSEGTTDLIDLLVDHGADVNLTDRHGWTALTFAVRMSWLEGVMRLLERGAQTTAGAFPVHLYSFHQDMARALGCGRPLRQRYLMEKWRKATRARACVVFWMGVTQEALCAPGGKGRKRDYDAYASELGE